jgi:hypothetical protein
MITDAVLISCLSRYWGLAEVRVSVHNGGMGSQTWFADLGDRRWVAEAVAPLDGPALAGGLAIAVRVEQAGIPAGPAAARHRRGARCPRGRPPGHHVVGPAAR